MRDLEETYSLLDDDFYTVTPLLRMLFSNVQVSDPNVDLRFILRPSKSENQIQKKMSKFFEKLKCIAERIVIDWNLGKFNRLVTVDEMMQVFVYRMLPDQLFLVKDCVKQPNLEEIDQVMEELCTRVEFFEVVKGLCMFYANCQSPSLKNQLSKDEHTNVKKRKAESMKEGRNSKLSGSTSAMKGNFSNSSVPKISKPSSFFIVSLSGSNSRTIGTASRVSVQPHTTSSALSLPIHSSPNEPSIDEDENIHPSWKAKRNMKYIVQFQGSKLQFE